MKVEREYPHGLVRVEVKSLCGGTPSFTASIKMIRQDSKTGNPRNYTSDEAYDDLAIEIRGSVYDSSTKGREINVYKFTEYRDCWRVGLTKARHMSKVLSDLERKLDAYAKAWGHPETYKQYLRHVLKALGVVSVARERKAGAMYDDGEYVWMNHEDTIYYVECELAKWTESVLPNKEVQSASV